MKKKVLPPLPGAQLTWEDPPPSRWRGRGISVALLREQLRANPGCWAKIRTSNHNSGGFQAYYKKHLGPEFEVTHRVLHTTEAKSYGVWARYNPLPGVLA